MEPQRPAIDLGKNEMDIDSNLKIRFHERVCRKGCEWISLSLMGAGMEEELEDNGCD